MFAVAPTDLDWYTQLRASPATTLINFWTPTPWNVRSLSIGDRLYFLLKSPIRKIGGFGEFARYENMTVQKAWQAFGQGNGVQSLLELIERTGKYVDTRSSQESVKSDSLIGCIILSNAVFFDDQDFFVPEERGISFPPQIVKLKYFREENPELLDITPKPTALVPTTIEPFQLVHQKHRSYRKGLMPNRPGQSRFREAVLAAYDRRCALTGETIGEIVEAAHIQPYLGLDSDHIQNGIALRVDLHRLFDAGLLTFDENYCAVFSPKLNSSTYSGLQGNSLRLPSAPKLHPSSEALAFHRTKVFRTEF